MADEPWLPTVDDVAALLLARATQAGNWFEFEGDTPVVTDDDVRDRITTFIALGAGDALTRLPTPLPAGLHNGAKGAIALYASILAEAALYPEQVESNRSPAELYWKMYERAADSLVKAAAEGGPDQDPATPDPTPLPAHTFPCHIPARW